MFYTHRIHCDGKHVQVHLNYIVFYVLEHKRSKATMSWTVCEMWLETAWLADGDTLLGGKVAPRFRSGISLPSPNPMLNYEWGKRKTDPRTASRCNFTLHLKRLFGTWLPFKTHTYSVFVPWEIIGCVMLCSCVTVGLANAMAPWPLCELWTLNSKEN